ANVQADDFIASREQCLHDPNAEPAGGTRDENTLCHVGSLLVGGRGGNDQEDQGFGTSAMQFMDDAWRNEGDIVGADDAFNAVGDDQAFTAQHVVDLLLNLVHVRFNISAGFIARNPVIEEAAATDFRRHNGL